MIEVAGGYKFTITEVPNTFAFSTTWVCVYTCGSEIMCFLCSIFRFFSVETYCVIVHVYNKLFSCNVRDFVEYILCTSLFIIYYFKGHITPTTAFFTINSGVDCCEIVWWCIVDMGCYHNLQGLVTWTKCESCWKAAPCATFIATGTTLSWQPWTCYN